MAQKSTNLPVTTSRQLIYMYFVLFAINSTIVYLANRVAPNAIVLGTAHLSELWSLLHSMGKLSLLGIIFVPLMEYWQEQKGEELAPKHWMGAYLAINFASLWLISRFAEQYGLGFSSWWVILVLAVILDWAQGLGMMLVYKKK